MSRFWFWLGYRLLHAADWCFIRSYKFGSIGRTKLGDIITPEAFSSYYHDDQAQLPLED